jgi:uncharacterized protein YecE (DUF72 family)
VGEIRIGVSGWSYREWRGVFYPKGMAQDEELGYTSARVNSIEINGTFYRLQSPRSFESWAGDTPDDFVFAVKGSKYITHQKKLNEAEVPLANYFASGVLLLGKKLGPILWQFAPWYRFDPGRMETFLKLLPRDAKQAASLARKNTIRDAERKSAVPMKNVKLRYAFEPRHESFFVSEFTDLLQEHNAAMVVSDTGGKFPYAENITADFVYVRLHGNELYKSDYRDSELDEWAKRIRKWRSKKLDTYVYFDNTFEGHAINNAIYLAKQFRQNATRKRN